MNVMFLVHSLALAGTERQITVLAKGLAKRGHRVSVASFYGGPLEKELGGCGIPLYILKSARGRRDLGGLLFRLFALIQRERPEFLHSFLESPNVLAVLLRPFLPGVRIVWGVRSTEVGGTDFGHVERVFQFLCRKLARFADTTIVNSRRGYSVCMSNGYPKDRTSIVFNGIDVDRFKPDPDARRRFRSELDLGADDILIGRVGRLHGMKDHDTFLKAGARVCRSIPTVKLVCVGDGKPQDHRRLIDLARQLDLQGRITFLPSREDIVAVYNGLDLLVSSSSHSEGFPNVIAESMSCGVLCVATDVGDARLIIGDDSLTVPPADPKALADAIERALSNRSGGDVARVRARITGNFNIERLVSSTEEVLLRFRSEPMQAVRSSCSSSDPSHPAR